MREIRPSGSVRGVRRKPYPYRDSPQPDAVGSVVFREGLLEVQTAEETVIVAGVSVGIGRQDSG